MPVCTNVFRYAGTYVCVNLWTGMMVENCSILGLQWQKRHGLYPPGSGSAGGSRSKMTSVGVIIIIINRLKIGHSRSTHSYLLSGDDQPTCTKCDAVLTVKHILLDCPALRDVRLKYFTAPSLKDIFESGDNQIIIDFIKDDHFYHQL